MRLSFHGAARTVTGSKHLLETGNRQILVDCGLFQGKRKEAFEMNRKLEGIDPEAVDAVLLTHAHIDHSGSIPTLVSRGFEGDIVCTHATRDLANIMLRDSAHIQEFDVAYVNKKRMRAGKTPFEPLYTMDDAINALQYFVSYNYNRFFALNDDIKMKFYDAGHILGSAMIMVQAEGKNILFSGDLGRKNLPILRDPDSIDLPVDYLVIESTYGDRLHDDIENMEKELADVITKTVKRNGKVIVPSFSVGRTQELVYALHRLFIRKQIPDVPVFVDSPLSVNATSVFRLHAECFDRETHDFLIREGDPFGFDSLRYIQHVEDSKKLNDTQDPMIIISASGMAEAGRILHHLKNNVEDERNTVLFVGFQAENTLGRKILTGETPVKIFGEPYEVNAEVARIESFSAHADRDELLGFVKGLKQDPEKIFVVHGEEESALAFARSLGEISKAEIHVPEMGEGYELK